MARQLLTGTNVDPADATNPFGKVRDDSSPTATDGTLLNEVLTNDPLIFFQKLLDEAGITANDLPEDETNGFQFIEALRAFIFRISGGSGLMAQRFTNLPNTGAGEQYLDIAFGNNTFVTVKADGSSRAATSPDGINWTPRITALDSLAWRSIHFAAGLFVAGSSSGDIMTSSDGITWTLRTSPMTVSISTITSSDSVIVAVGADGGGNAQGMTSPDGITWTIRTVPNGNWDDSTFGNGLFVVTANVGGSANQIVTSPDGITWTARTPTTQQGTNGINNIAFLSTVSRFVTVESTTVADAWAYSDDGITWNAMDPDPGGPGRSWSVIFELNGVLIACANAATNNIARSVNGLNWIVSTDDAFANEAIQEFAVGLNLAVGVAATNQASFLIQ